MESVGDTPDSAGSLPRALAMVLAAYMIWLAAFGLFTWWAMQIDIQANQYIALASALVCGISTALVIMTTVDVPAPNSACLVLVLFFGAIVILAYYTIRNPYIAALVTNTALIGMAFSVGRMIAMGIQENAHLIPALIVMALMDFWSVYFGVSAHMVENRPEIMDMVMLRYPMPGITSGVSLGPPPVVGGMDFCFMAIFLPAAKRFDLGPSRVFFGLVVSLAVFLIAVNYFQIKMPYAPFMAAGLFAVTGRRLEWNAQYLKLTALFVVGFYGLLYTIGYFLGG